MLGFEKPGFPMQPCPAHLNRLTGDLRGLLSFRNGLLNCVGLNSQRFSPPRVLCLVQYHLMPTILALLPRWIQSRRTPCSLVAAANRVMVFHLSLLRITCYNHYPVPDHWYPASAGRSPTQLYRGKKEEADISHFPWIITKV